MLKCWAKNSPISQDKDLLGKLYHVKQYLLVKNEAYEKTYTISKLLIVESLRIKLAQGNLYYQKKMLRIQNIKQKINKDVFLLEFLFEE